MGMKVGSVDVGPRIVTEFPGASEMVVDVLAAGTEIEIHLVMVLAMLSGSDPQAAAIVLRQMRSVADQEKAVLNVANARLTKEAFDIVTIATRAIAPQRTRRNRFAHCQWGRSRDLPGAIFLLETSVLAHYLTGLLRGQLLSSFDIREEDIYRLDELRVAREEAAEATKVMQTLIRYVVGAHRPEIAYPGDHAGEALMLLRQFRSFAEAEKRFRRQA